MYHKPKLEAVGIKSANRSVQIFERKDKHFSPFWHYHPEVELTLITEGNGLRFVGDSIEGYNAGDLVLLGSNLPHQWVSDNADSNINSAIVLQFRSELFDNYTEFVHVRKLLKRARHGIQFPVSNPLASTIMDSVHQKEAFQVGTLITLMAELTKLTDSRTLSKETRFRGVASDQEFSRINDALSFILENLGNKLTVDHMAELVHMVPQSFCRWFRQNTGSSFVDYLNKTRVESACRLLLTTTSPVSEIANTVGFENISHFNRTFKKYTGTSPLKFRKGVRN